MLLYLGDLQALTALPLTAELRRLSAIGWDFPFSRRQRTCGCDVSCTLDDKAVGETSKSSLPRYLQQGHCHEAEHRIPYHWQPEIHRY